MAELNCTTTWLGIPKTCIEGNPIRAAAGFYFITKDKTLTPAEAYDDDELNTLVLSKDIIHISGVWEIEDVSIEKKVEESTLGKKKTNHRGYRGYRVMLDYNLDQHQALLNMQGKAFDIIPYDTQGNIMFAKSGSTNLKGFAKSYFDVEKLPVPTGDGSMKSVIEIQEKNLFEADNMKYTNPTLTTTVADRFSPEDIKTITKVTLTAGSVTAGVFTLNVDLVSASYMLDGSLNSKGVTGLVVANIKLYDAAGAAVSIDSVTESTTTPGEYEIDASTAVFTTGTVDIESVLADENYYEADAISV